MLNLLAAALLAAAPASSAVPPSPATPTVRPPETRKGDDADDFFGTRVADPYRWLEDPDSAETRSWVEAQNAATQAWLAGVPERSRHPRPAAATLGLRALLRRPPEGRPRFYLRTRAWRTRPRSGWPGLPARSRGGGVRGPQAPGISQGAREGGWAPSTLRLGDGGGQGGAPSGLVRLTPRMHRTPRCSIARVKSVSQLHQSDDLTYEDVGVVVGVAVALWVAVGVVVVVAVATASPWPRSSRGRPPCRS